MFEIPTSWTSTGLVWDFADPLWLRHKLDLCNIEAVKEKYAATSGTVPALLSAEYNPIRALQTMDYITAAHNEITALIPLFVNHLLPAVTPGNYNGETTIPVFTEATILAAIGDSTRIIPTHLSTLSGWYFQTKKILDMLMWVKDYGIFIESDRRSNYYGMSETWDIAESGFNKNTFDNVIPDSYGFGYHGYCMYTGAGVFWKMLKRIKKTFGNRGINANCVTYRYGTAYFLGQQLFYFQPLPIGTEEQQALGNPINTLSAVEHFSSVLSISTHSCLSHECEQTLQAPALNISFMNIGRDLNDFFAILKFDTPNGFKFKASSPST